MREIHFFCSPRSRKLRELVGQTPTLQRNLSCNPENIPVGSVCYQVEEQWMPMMERGAEFLGLRFEPGIVGQNYLCVHPYGPYLFAGAADGRVYSWDIADPKNPVALNNLSMGGGQPVVDIAVDQGVLYALDAGSSLYRVNINDPSALALVSGLTVATGRSYTHLRVAALTAFLSGEGAGAIGVYDLSENNTSAPFRLIVEIENEAGAVAIQGPRLYFGESSGSPAKIYSMKLTKSYCAMGAFGELWVAGKISAEMLRVRRIQARGEVLVDELTVTGGKADTDTGSANAANYFRVGTVYILWGTGDPNGAGFPHTQGSVFHRTDGGAGTTFYVNEDGTDTGWAGK